MRLRNRLAGAVLAALGDGQARRELAVLADAGAAGWLQDEETGWAKPLVERARAATSALADCPLLAHESDLGQALQAASALFEAGLYFEVHEVLEPHWIAASGTTREALQGLIQVAVAWQHIANDNRAGGRSLLVEGSRRLHGRRLFGTDLEPFARAAAAAADGVAARRSIHPSAFPRFEPVRKEES